MTRPGRHAPALPAAVAGLVGLLLVASATALPSFDHASTNGMAGSSAGSLHAAGTSRRGAFHGWMGSPRAPLTSLPPSFWGVNVRPDYAWNRTLTGDLVATPTSLVRWPGGGFTDRYDPLANHGLGVFYNDNGSTNTPKLSTASFLALCKNLSLEVIFSLPGEINSTSQVKAEVVYVEQTLGFRPYAWEIGNEPALWTHFNVPWTSWSSTQSKSPTFAQYTQLVASYVTTIRAIDPSTPIIGLGGVGSGDNGETDWINATVAAPGVNAVAIHVYPDGTGYSGEGLTGFYAGLSGGASLTWRVPRDEQALSSSCPGCHVELLVSEVGASQGSTLASYLSGFPMVPYVSAEVVQAIGVGVSAMAYWVFQGSYAGAWFTPTYGPVAPVYTAYARVFPELPRTNLLLSSAASSSTGDYALLGSNASTLALFAVNANATNAWSLNLTNAGLNVLAGPGSALTWSSATPQPVLASYATHLPSSWVLPPMSIALFRTFQAPSPPPVLSVSASAYPTSGGLPLTTLFSSTASGGSAPYAVSWTFGDGGAPSASWSPVHTYNASGSFTATVSVRDTLGQVASRSIPISVLAPAGQLLAAPTLSPTIGTYPLAVLADGSASGGHPPYLYNWSFGDASPNSLSQNTSHVYAATGTYAVTLVVTDTTGAESASTVQLQVGAPLLAEILANRTSGTAPLLVGLEGSVSGGFPPYRYAWSFGDGTTGSGAYQNHTFPAVGLDLVQLSVRDAAGDVATQTLNVDVTAAASPVVVQLQGPSQLSVGGNATFVAVASGGVGPLVYAWDFGDGTPTVNTRTGTVSHVYASAGSYLVTVRVSDTAGHAATASMALSVQDTLWSVFTEPVLGIPWVLLLTGLLLALLVPLLLWRRWRGRREAPPDEPAPGPPRSR